MSEWDETTTKLTDADWEEIEDLNDRIQAHTGSWGKMAGGEEKRPGVFTAPYAEHDPLIFEFLDLWDTKNLMIPFKWAEWDEGRDWYASKDKAKYAKLDAEMALKLLTAVTRNGRFNEGALMRGFEDGDFPKIINKFVSLRGR